MRRSSFLALLLLTNLIWAAPTAPRIEGKTAAQWLQLLRTDNRDQWNRAADVLMMNADRAVGPLTAALGDKDARVRRGAAQGLRQLKVFPQKTRQTLRDHLSDPSLSVRREVVETLLYAGDYEADLPQALRSLLNAPDAELRQSLGYVLRLLPLDRKPYLDVLLEALKNPDPTVRADAASALARRSELSTDTAAPLREALSDPVLQVRLEAAYAYWLLTEDSAALPLIVAALRNGKTADDRATAAEYLWVIGKPAREAFAALAEAALGDADGRVRAAAAKALPMLGASTEVALPVYVQLMQDKRADAWEGALQGLVDLGPAALPALPDLLPQLMTALRGEHIFSSVPKLAAEAVGLVGPAAHAALPLLVRLANLPSQDPWDVMGAPPATPKGVDRFSISSNSETQRAALVAMAKVATSAEALPHLLKALQSKDAWMVMLAADTIGSFGPPARAAIVPLVHAIVTENDKVSYMGLNETLFRALISLDPTALPGNLLKIAQKRPGALSDLRWLAPEIDNPGDYVAPLIALAQRPPSEQATSVAAELLAVFGVRAPEAAEALGKLLNAKTPGVQMNVTESLRGMGPAALPALPYLLTALKNGDEFTRFGSIQVIEVIGPGAASAVPLLMGIVRDAKLDEVERVSAAWAVKSAGGDVSKLVAPLTEILGLPGAKACGGAAELLGEIGAPATEAIPVLRRALTESRPYSRVQVAKALWLLSGETAAVVPALSGVATGEMGHAKVASILLLGEIGPAAVSEAPVLQGLLGNTSLTVTIAAALSLANITGDGNAVVGTVVKALLRPTTTDSLGDFMLTPMLRPALSPFGERLVGPLIDALKQATDENRQVELVVFLPLLGAAAKAAEPELEKLVATGTDGNPGAAALQALLTIRGRQRLPDTSQLMRCFGDDMPWRFPVPN